jgi:hypothetical protein
VTCSSEMSVSLRTTCLYNPEDFNHRCISYALTHIHIYIYDQRYVQVYLDDSFLKESVMFLCNLIFMGK